MKSTLSLIFCVFTLILNLFSNSYSASNSKSSESKITTSVSAINFKTIKKYYQDGDFDKVRKTLEPHMKNGAVLLSQEEKIFTYKYLGVVYAVDSSTIPLSKNAFYQLIKLAPTIELADMYVTDKILNLFREVKKQTQSDMEYAQKYDEFGKPLPPNKNNTTTPQSVLVHKNTKGDEDHDEKKSQSLNSHALVWTAAVAGAVIVSGGAWWYLSQSNGKSTTQVPEAKP